MSIATDLQKALTAFKANQRKTIVVKDEQLMAHLEEFVQVLQPLLKGEYQPYGIYQDEAGKVYGLIHAFYSEQNDLSWEDMPHVTAQDAQFLHEQLQSAGLALDYFFIMPYYDQFNKSAGSVMIEVIITKADE